jgi:hypothetical protein
LSTLPWAAYRQELLGETPGKHDGSFRRALEPDLAGVLEHLAAVDREALAELKCRFSR